MKYIYLIVLSFLFVGCISSSPKPTPVVDANSSEEFELLSHIVNNELSQTTNFLEDGVNPNISSKGVSAIEIAVRLQYPKMVELLLEYGANPSEPVVDTSLQNMSIVALAASLEDEKILRLLFEYGADVQKLNNYNVMVGAITKKRTNNLEFLLTKGFDVNAKNDRNTSILMYSAHKDDTAKLTKILLEHGADVNATNIKQMTPLLMAIDKQKNIQNVEYLLKFGADVNYRDDLNATPLSYVIVKSTDLPTLKLLISYGADVESKVLNLATPVMLALELDKYAMAQVIMDNLTTKDEAYLYIALRYGKKKMFNFLLDDGYEIKKLKLSKEWINMFVANKRYEALQKYFNIYGLDTFELRYISKQAQSMIVEILDKLYKNNKLSEKQKLHIAISLYNIEDKQRAFQWLQDVAQESQPAKWRCFMSADVGMTDKDSCKELLKIYQEDEAKLSWIYLLLEQYEDVIFMANKAIDENNEYYPFSNMGHAYLLQGEKEKAYLAYKQYFFKNKDVFSLHALNSDFKMLKMLYPGKTALFDEAYTYSMDVDYEVFE